MSLLRDMGSVSSWVPLLKPAARSSSFEDSLPHFFLFFFKVSNSCFGHPLVREWEEVTCTELSSSRTAMVWVKNLI